MWFYAGDVIANYPSLFIGFLGKVVKKKIKPKAKHFSDVSSV
jgi:hypothetical protein